MKVFDVFHPITFGLVVSALIGQVIGAYDNLEAHTFVIMAMLYNLNWLTFKQRDDGSGV